MHKDFDQMGIGGRLLVVGGVAALIAAVWLVMWLLSLIHPSLIFLPVALAISHRVGRWVAAGNGVKQ